MNTNVKKTIYIFFLLIAVIILTVIPIHNISSFSHSENGTPLNNVSLQRIVSSKIYPIMTVRLTSSLKPINGYSYGNFGVPTTFYASVINGTGTYTYHWFVNGTLVRTVTTTSNISSLTWNFTNPSKFGEGIYDYINVTVTDTSNQSSSASYYGLFWYEPEISLSVSGNDAVDTPGTMNITVNDWFGVSPLNLTVFVNGKPIYRTLTPGWGAGFPISIKYNFAKTGIYNITAVAYDDSGQRIAANFNITVISHVDYIRDVFYNYLKYDFSPGSLIFFAMFIFLLTDIIIDIRRK
jgi:hypothetical protein